MAARQAAGLGGVRGDELERDPPALARRRDDRGAALEQCRARPSRRLVDEAAHRACRRAPRAAAPAAARGSPPTGSAVAARRAEQPDDHGTSPTSSSTVPDAIGVGDRGLDPAALDRRDALRARVVPRTCPARADSRSRPSSRPRQPQPTISARAKLDRPLDPLLVLETPVATAGGRARGPPRPPRPSADVVLGHLGLAAPAAVSRSGRRSSAARRRSRAAPRPRASGSASSRPGRRRCPDRPARAAPGRGRSGRPSPMRWRRSPRCLHYAAPRHQSRADGARR